MEASSLQDFAHKHQARAVPQQNLQPVGALRTKDDDQPGMRIEPERVLNEASERVVPAPKIDGTHGEYNP